MNAGQVGVRSRHNRGGFSIVEMLFVLIIAGLLITMGANSFRKFETFQNVENARSELILLGRRARTAAIEKGTTVQVDIDADTKRAWISVGGTLIDQVYFDQFHVEMVNGTGARVTVCYNARGFALTSTCTTTLPTTVTFSLNGTSLVVQVKPLGQLVKS
jgi:Tfp pilus assembly protein FimT